MIERDDKDDGLLSWLQRWYASQVNGEWEHVYGVSISTLDNPGWRLKIDLKDTELERGRFERVELERTEDDWVRCWIKGDLFEGACGPKNLVELLSHFRAFVQPHKPDETGRARRDPSEIP
jgi:hypothetical protein